MESSSDEEEDEIIPPKRRALSAPLEYPGDGDDDVDEPTMYELQLVEEIRNLAQNLTDEEKIKLMQADLSESLKNKLVELSWFNF